MYKVIIIRNSGEKIDVKDFDNKPEAFAVYLKLVNEEYENIDRLKKFIVRKNEVIIRGDLFFSREYAGHNDYILIVGRGLEEYKRVGKYKQIIKKYITRLLY